MTPHPQMSLCIILTGAGILLSSCQNMPRTVQTGRLEVGGITSPLVWDANHRFKVSQAKTFAFQPGGQPNGWVQVAMDKTYQGAQARTAIYIRAPQQNSQNVSGMFILYDAS